MIAAAPTSPLQKHSRSANDGPDEISNILAGIQLDNDVNGDDEEEDESELQASSLSAILQDITSKLTQVKDQFFVIQEKRHAGVFALAELDGSRPDGSSLQSPSIPRDGEAAEKSVALDLAMAQLNTLLESISDGMKSADVMVSRIKSNVNDGGPMLGFSPRRRTASIASLSSLDSFDDAFLNIDTLANTPKGLAKRYEELSSEWTKVQAEATRLEEELSSDKYLLVFISICKQMEEMMDSLDKALASCHDFIFAIHKERADSILQLAESQWANPKERLSNYMAVKRSFDVKKSSYGPACEQMFVTLQKGLTQKTIQNGSILRQLADLKTRWRGLRESVAKTDKDLKRVEIDLMGVGADTQSSPSQSSHSGSLVTPSRPDRPKSQAGAKMGSATKTPTSMNQSMSPGDFYSNNSPLRPLNHNSKVVSSPPVKPAKSIYRHSFMAARPSTSEQLPQSRFFSSTEPSLQTASSPRTIRGDLSHRVPTSPSLRIVGASTSTPRAVSGDAAHLERVPVSSTSRFARGGSEPPNRDANSSQWPNGRQSISQADEGNRSDIGDTTFTLNPTAQNGPDSALAMYQRPASAAGFYYRPPSSNGHREDVGGSSRIPRLATGARNVDSQSNAGDRPSSALSFTSSIAYGKSPGNKMSYTRSAYPPSSFHRNADHGNRLSMQTPEPTIAARARRMNTFAPKQSSMATPPTSKRSSRPPPAKYNASIYGATSANNNDQSYSSSAPNYSTGTTGNYRISLNTAPLTINKRESMTISATGRTTPLSAAALAKVPHAGPDLGAHTYNVASNEKSSSVVNYRTLRSEQQSAGNRSYTPSIRSGRETPTFSDAGDSSVWGGGLSRRMAAVYSYRANPNDAIDVEVGNIVNSLGMAIERVDPPLPRGVKDLTPSSTKTVKYEVGGKIIVVKLLQLHRPSSVQSNQDKTNKVLTRVGGGWIDLRQYLLSRMGTVI